MNNETKEFTSGESLISGYEKIAKSLGFDFASHKSQFIPFFLGKNFINSQWCSMRKDPISFWASDMYTSSPYFNSTYCGVYIDTGLNLEVSGELSKRFSLTDIFAKKTGDKFIDKNVTIKSDDPEKFRSLLDKESVLLFLDIWKRYQPVMLVIKPGEACDNPQYQRSKNTIISIQTNKWIEPEELPSFIEDCMYCISLIIPI
ncbi:MAG: hypothetical protein RR202_09530 [Bacteroidales bacterium]